jgi:hypothetical protein
MHLAFAIQSIHFLPHAIKEPQVVAIMSIEGSNNVNPSIDPSQWYRAYVRRWDSSRIREIREKLYFELLGELRDKIIEIQSLPPHMQKIIESSEIEIRSYLLHVYLSDLDHSSEFSSLVFHLLRRVKSRESTFYLFSLLPSLDTLEGFLMCYLWGSLSDNNRPHWMGSGIGDESYNVHFYASSNTRFVSQAVVLFQRQLDLVKEECVDGAIDSNLFEYLSRCYLENKIDQDQYIEILIGNTNYHTHNFHHIVSIVLSINDLHIIQIMFRITKILIANAYGTVNKADSGRIRYLSLAFESPLRQFIQYAGALSNHALAFDILSEIQPQLTHFEGKQKTSLKKHLESALQKQKKGIATGRTYKSPFRFSDFTYQYDLLRKIKFYRKLDTGRFFDEGRTLENEIRVEIGIPKVGEKWKNETMLFALVKSIYENKATQVVHHYRPEFLHGQELDIYLEIGSRRIGIEYQGVQHFKPVDYFGGEEGFKKTVERDQRKLRLCRENNFELFYVRYDEEVTPELIRRLIG